MSASAEKTTPAEPARPGCLIALTPLMISLVALFISLAALLVAIAAYLTANSRSRGSFEAAPTVRIESPDDILKRKILGSWRDDYYGERTMTFVEDGTGTMLLKLDPVSRLIIGEKLMFYLAWDIKDGVMTMKFTGGEPKGTVETISKEWGDTHHQAVEVLTESDLHLRSTDSQNLYTLKRPPEESP